MAQIKNWGNDKTAVQRTRCFGAGERERYRTEQIDDKVAAEKRTICCENCKTKYLIFYSGNN
jgi:hypothetical protein